MRSVPFLFVATLLASRAAAQSAAQPAAHWSVTGNAFPDFTIALDSTVAHDGRTSVRIAADDDPGGFAGPVTVLAPAPYAGRHLRITAYLRTASLGDGGAALWARADTATGPNATGAFATTQGRRLIVGTADWTPATIELNVPANARTILVGAISMGRGTLWLDDLSVDGGGAAYHEGFEDPSVATFPKPAPPTAAQIAARLAARSPHESARALTPRGLENVVAFARLTGYVRFFHPTDAAAATNWDEFTVRGVRLVEQAPNADSLARTLRALFAPVAPTVAVFRTGTHAPAPPAPPAGTTGVVFWRHFGYGVPTATPNASPNNIYDSERVLVPLTDGRPPATTPFHRFGPATAATDVPVPDPARPYVAELGGGLSASVPLALYTSDVIIPDSLRHARLRPAAERFSLDDRATRLADATLLWMVPQHFYPYFDVVHTDWTGALRTALAEAATDDAARLDATLERQLAALHDGHGNLYRPGTVRAALPLRLGWVEGRVVVTALGDSAGDLRRGDELLAIDGVPIADALREQESRVSGATPQWIRTAALSRLGSGAPGGVVTLRVRDALAPDAPPRDVRVARVAGPLPQPPLPDRVAELRPGVMYVDLGRATDDDVTAALPKLQQATAIVFDMRGYPRGNTTLVLAMLTDSVIHSARFEVPIVTRPDGAGVVFDGSGRWALPPRQPRLRARVAFLTGGGAISYAESTMGVVEDNKLAPIVGEPTAGTNGNVNPFPLPGGYMVYWTGMRVRKNDGTPHHGVGIRPTVPVSPTLRGVRDGRDDVLERALALVTGAAM